jgi:glycosyltransferase involved in cell wall biosynthesis
MSSNFSGRYYNIQEIGIAKALNRLGHRCDVVFWGGKTEENSFEVPYSPEASFTVYFKKGVKILTDIVFSNMKKMLEGYDILHTTEYDQIYSWMLARLYPEKTIIYHGPYYCDFNRKYNLKCHMADAFFVRSYRKADTPFLVKSRLAEGFLQSKGIRNIHTIGVGLDSEQIGRDRPEISEFSQELSRMQADGTRLLLYIGQLEPRRNILFLLNVFSGVRKLCANVKLVIIGSGEEDYIRKCWDTSDELGIRGDIVYQNRLRQNLLPAVYSACTVFLLPTLYEIFGMVLLEAMYFGCVPVSTHNGGADMLINDGKNGFVLRSLDLDVWIDRVTGLLNEPRLLQDCSAAAQETIGNNYTWEALANQFVATYEKLLDKNKK